MMKIMQIGCDARIFKSLCTIKFKQNFKHNKYCIFVTTVNLKALYQVLLTAQFLIKYISTNNLF